MIHQLRVASLTRLDSALQPFGYYAAYTLPEDEFAGSCVDAPLPESYEYQPLAAVKTHPWTDEVEDGSYRKVPTEHPPVDARITREYDPSDCQYHVHVFGDELFSHYELRPDVLGCMYAHYHPEHGETYLRGVTCPEIDEILE